MNRLKPEDAAELSKMRLRAWLKILKTSGLIEKILRERFREVFGTTLPRFDVMSALSRTEKGMKMSRLSSVLKVSNGNVTGIIDRLVQDGDVVRVAVEGDRRTNLVRLTAKGQNRFSVFAHAHERWVNEILADLEPGDTRTVIGLLDLISNRGDVV